jgi:hypothetical protein
MGGLFLRRSKVWLVVRARHNGLKRLVVGFLAYRLERSSEPKAHEARLLILNIVRS